MDLIELASTLFGNKRSESESTKPDASVSIVSATGATDSSDGSCGVVMDCDITPADDTDGDESILDMPTSPVVKVDDDVLVALAGDGPLKTPVVLANPGFGDRIQTQVENAEDLASRAQELAAATSQHFWSDDSGAHVTETTQDEWAENESGPNSLWNSLGMLFRDGLTNLLAILTDGLVIYDGEGNANTNIVAAIGKIVRLGYEAAAHVIISSGSIGMFSGENEIFSLVGSETVHEDTSSTTTSDISTMSVGNGENGKASLSFERYHYHSASQDSYRNDIELGIDTDNDGTNNTYFRLTDVIDTDSSSGTPQGSAKLKASYLALENDSTDGWWTTGQVMEVLSGGVTLYDNESAAASATATLNESAANFRRLTIFYRDTDGNHSSVDVWSPNGKRVSLSLTWINGADSQQMYQRVRWVTISETTIATYRTSSSEKYRTGQVRLGATADVANNDYIAITHVIGYR